MSPRTSVGLLLGILAASAGMPLPSARAQTQPGGRDVASAKPQFAGVVESSNQFAFDLYGRLRGDQGNLFVSPTSISTALAMALAGASGETAAEMAKTLHFQASKDQLNEAMRGLLDSWKTSDKKQGFQLNVANRLWAQDSAQFLPAYLTVTRTDYGAELARLDFAHHAEESRQTINKWVEDQTQGKIKDLILSAAQLSETRLVLTNAVYFKGEWTDPFKKEQTKNEDFRLSAQQTVKALLMHTRHSFKYAAADGVQVLELPYGDGSLSMLALLPENKDGLADLEARLTFANWQQWTSGLTPQQVIVYLPRFRSTSQFGLAPVLKAMGMTTAFDPRAADFSGMTGARDLYLSAVLHKAYVDVNEEGTEAAAATGTIMRATAIRLPPHKPPVFRADHPFLFAIRDNRNGAILFLGRVANPTQP